MTDTTTTTTATDTTTTAPHTITDFNAATTALAGTNPNTGD